MAQSDNAKVYSNLIQLDQRGDTGGEPLYTILPRPATSTREQCRSWRRYIIPITISLVTAAICLSMSSYNLSKLSKFINSASNTLISSSAAPSTLNPTTPLRQNQTPEYEATTTTTTSASSTPPQLTTPSPPTVRCPSGWILNPFSKTCLKASGFKITWAAAKRFCESFGNTNLATFETLESASWFQQQRKNDPAWLSSHPLWIGGRYENGAWSWFGRITGPILFSFWGPGEPNNLDVEKCIDTHGDYSWNNNNCSASYQIALCERGPV